MRNNVLGDIGVKIDVGPEWTDGFRRAIRFWNMVVAAKFHEETKLNGCSIRIIYGRRNVVNRLVVARSQMIDRDDFRGKIAVSPTAPRELSSPEIYATAVHEIGHMLGLKHNTRTHSVMYFLNVDGTEALDGEDILELSRLHKVRPEILERRLFSLTPTSVDTVSRQVPIRFRYESSRHVLEAEQAVRDSQTYPLDQKDFKVTATRQTANAEPYPARAGKQTASP